MKLSEMKVKTSEKINKLMESRFGFAINYDVLTVEKAERLSETIAANLNKIRHTVDFHTAETNPRYMELLTVQEGLDNWLASHRQQLTEGEVGNAEVLLAAKDMVDSIQDAIEKVGKMSNEQLPQLLDSIRDQIGSEQSDAFKTAVGPVLEQLLSQLGQARDGVDAGVRILSGEQVTPMELGGETPAEPAPDLSGAAITPSELDQEETDGFAATDAAVGGSEELGREKR